MPVSAMDHAKFGPRALRFRAVPRIPPRPAVAPTPLCGLAPVGPSSS